MIPTNSSPDQTSHVRLNGLLTIEAKIASRSAGSVGPEIQWG